MNVTPCVAPGLFFQVVTVQTPSPRRSVYPIELRACEYILHGSDFRVDVYLKPVMDIGLMFGFKHT